jgi:hypothetical protein
MSAADNGMGVGTPLTMPEGELANAWVVKKVIASSMVGWEAA